MVMKNKDDILKKDVEKYKELVDSGISATVSINKFMKMNGQARKRMLEIMEAFREEN